MAMANSGVKRLHVAGSLRLSYVPASYVVYTAHSGAQLSRLRAGTVMLRPAWGGLGRPSRVSKDREGAELLCAGF